MSAAPVYASRHRGDARHLHVIGPQQPVTSGAEAMLIERTLELDVLGNAVTRLAEGEGAIVVLEAPAGLGKTALLDHAAQQATRAGCRVRRAAPGPLERHFAFGVVRALLEAPLRDASGERARAPARGRGGPGRRAAARRGRARRPTRRWRSPTACCGCAPRWPRRRPLALVVDDAQWADRASLEVLAYLARRIDDVPLLHRHRRPCRRSRRGGGPPQPASAGPARRRCCIPSR